MSLKIWQKIWLRFDIICSNIHKKSEIKKQILIVKNDKLKTLFSLFFYFSYKDDVFSQGIVQNQV